MQLPNKDDKITITVEGYRPNDSLQLTMNWDADLDDWINTFRTILIYQTFSEDSIKELFEDQWSKYENDMKHKEEILKEKGIC
jgi:hypothetical protein